LDIGEEPTPVLSSRFEETAPALSPDGRWLAYVSNESGSAEVYVQAFPGPGQRVQASNHGGIEPAWSPVGNELFYRDGAHLIAVPVSTEPVLQLGVPLPLFEDEFASSGGDRTNYDVDRDGQRFLMVSRGNVSDPTELHLVLNWFEELERLAPTN
jgi:Tol biopolymer transport system component